MKRRLTQKDWVGRQLVRGRELTALRASREYGIMRLAAIIFSLKRDGWKIETRRVESRRYNGRPYTPYAIYSLL